MGAADVGELVVGDVVLGAAVRGDAVGPFVSCSRRGWWNSRRWRYRGVVVVVGSDVVVVRQRVELEFAELEVDDEVEVVVVDAAAGLVPARDSDSQIEPIRIRRLSECSQNIPVLGTFTMEQRSGSVPSESVCALQSLWPVAEHHFRQLHGQARCHGVDGEVPQPHRPCRRASRTAPPRAQSRSPPPTPCLPSLQVSETLKRAPMPATYAGNDA